MEAPLSPYLTTDSRLQPQAGKGPLRAAELACQINRKTMPPAAVVRSPPKKSACAGFPGGLGTERGAAFGVAIRSNCPMVPMQERLEFPRIDAALIKRAAAVVESAKECGCTIVTAESCTGGLLAGLLTEVPGSSAVLERGFVTYSNAAKTDMLGVPFDLLMQFGAVSAQVAGAMAEGAIAHSRAHIAVSVTGIAGPGGGSEHKPVGLVHFARAERGGTTRRDEMRFEDNGRAGIRRAALDYALRLLEERIANN